MKKICPTCKHEFETHTRLNYCSPECQAVGKSLLRYPDGSDYVKCKICEYRGTDLHKHITKLHKMTAEQYCEKFNVEEIDLQASTIRKHNSDMQKKAYAEGRLTGWGKGDANPSRRQEVREGRRSVFSMNYYKYDGMTDEQKREEIQKLHHQLAEDKKKNHNNPLTIEYYIKRGCTEEEAKEKLKERQSTFSLQACIERHGEEEGLKVFNERQKKWQNTLNSKPLEEIERINKAKASQSKFLCSYSKVSQELFDKIYEQIKSQYLMIFYATKNNDDSRNSNENFEYEVLLEDGIHRYFLDFYVKDNNKVIEFDGDYWHGEKRGNRKRDMEREEKLKSLGFTQILHVRERDYRADPEKTVQACVEFIRKQGT